MTTIVESFDKIKSNILTAKPEKQVNIVAVSKTFDLDHIKPLIDYGHSHFGENKDKEEKKKNKEIKKKKKNIRKPSRNGKENK
mgnify:CR=1 FL=1